MNSKRSREGFKLHMLMTHEAVCAKIEESCILEIKSKGGQTNWESLNIPGNTTKPSDTFVIILRRDIVLSEKCKMSAFWAVLRLSCNFYFKIKLKKIWGIECTFYTLSLSFSLLSPLSLLFNINTSFLYQTLQIFLSYVFSWV